MPAKRTIAVTIVAVVAAGLAGLAIGVALNDPDESVSPVDLPAVASTTAPDPATEGGSVDARDQHQVPALDEVSGIVVRNGDDEDDLEVGGVDLDFGPDAWVATAGPMEDYDGDGAVESLRDELDGLVGQEARFRVHLDDEGDDGEVYTINDLTYREVGGPAPWQMAAAVSEAEIRAAAAAAVGAGARVVDLDAEDGRVVAWEAEVIDSQGRKYEVVLDAAGNVIDVRRD